jgi:hypothetical protein
MEEIKIQQLDPINFEFQDYIPSDQELIASSDLDTVFNPETDYVEFYVYDENNTLIYPVVPTTLKLSSYTVKKGDVLLNPITDLQGVGFYDSNYKILYNFYRERLNTSASEFDYFITEISSDRTEIRLNSNNISNLDLINSTNEFIQYRNDAEYFVDFLLNFGGNRTVIANNIKLEDEDSDNATILIKLYEPLPLEFDLKSILWVVEEISTPQMYEVSFPFIQVNEIDSNFISGPNFNLPIKDESGVSGQLHSLNSLLSSNLTSSYNQLKTLLDQNQIQINIDYENYSEFVNFSSAKTRLENFAYKAGLIESYTNSISASLGKITSDTTSSFAFSASKASYESSINEIINNFDGYDYFLYYNSGSKYSWPKETSSSPYKLFSTGSTEAREWLGSLDTTNIYYGGQILSASNYDQNNQDYLYWAIPEYLRDDSNNNQYLLFVDMVAQQYDNTWVYTKDLTNKFNADNRLEYGISKDLVADAIKDFGVKLYSNNFNTNDLYTTFLGLTPSGSLFPFPEITGSLPTPSGYEYVNTRISSSNDIVPLDGVNKRLYKRIYHNIPYLLKTKGTVAGLRALITSYGIPDTILRINEFGGKDKNNSQDWDLKQNIFNYAFDTEGKYIISSSFTSNNNFGGISPETVQFRFKTKGIPTGSWGSRYSQSLYYIPDNRSALVLEYTGSGFTSGSYSGSIADPYKEYGVLKFIPNITDSNISASLYFPFFDGNWWSIQTTVSSSNTASLYAANQINKDLGFSGSSTITGFDSGLYDGGSKIIFPQETSANVVVGGKRYVPFSGSYQEIRYYNTQIEDKVFYDYTMNPYSFEGNSVNSAPNELIFRADLGTLLNTGSTTSVHPKITGSSEFTTQSFASDSEFYISSSNFIVNRELAHQDQVIGGIKNRITDKININNPILPEGNTLSSIRSIQQTSFQSSSYTPDVDYLEVAFSPQDQINDDINAQMGYFNIGDYIGDPRHISQSSRSYPDLDTLRDAYFNKYINSYNLVDFVRLIKFFDNSLFKMIKDFTPARTSLSSGVVVKQHILERNRQRPPQISHENFTYSGSIKPQSRNYNTGSGDTGAYEFISGSSIYRFSGGTGGGFERYNGLKTSPSSSAYGLSNKFGLTQSFSESLEGTLGKEIQIIFNQDEFYNGEFSGSYLEVVTQSLSPGCIPYHKPPDTPLQYYPLFFSDSSTDILFGTTTLQFWQDLRNEPLPGHAWIFTVEDPATQLYEVKKIKLAARDNNNNEVRDYLLGTEFVQFIFPEGFKKYYVDGTVINANSATLTIDDTQGDYLFVSSSNGGSENWSLRVSGNISSSANPLIAGFDPNSQNYFHALSRKQTQAIRYYNSNYEDILGFFDTGSIDYLSTPIINNEEAYDWGVYTIPRTPNIPWIFSASIAYSASGGTEVVDPITTIGIYHTGSSNTSNLPTLTYPLDGLISKTASIKLPPVQIDLDSTFFNNTISNALFGDQVNPNRISYLFTTDTTPSNNTYKKIGFNNTDISLATQMFISLTDNEGGTWFDNADMQLFNNASSWNIYNPATDANRITITGATTSGNPIQGTSGNQWMIKQFSAGNAILSGSLFSDDDPIKVIPNTIPDASGHSKILQAGTASFDFGFDEFRVGGQALIPGAPRQIEYRFEAGQGFNIPQGHTNPDAVDAIANYTWINLEEEDGQYYVEINYNLLRQFVNDANGGIPDNVTVIMNYFITSDEHFPADNGSANDFDQFRNQISIHYRDHNSSGGSVGIDNYIPASRRFFQRDNNEQSIQATNIQNTIDISQSNTGLRRRYYLMVKGFDQTFNYWLTSWSFNVIYNRNIGVNAQQQVTISGGFLSQGSSTNKNKLFFKGAVPERTLLGDLQQRLWITGSHHHPQQLITSSLFVRNANISATENVTFPDSPINNIYRESSYTEDRYSVTGSGDVTFEYTDALTEDTISTTLSDGEIVYANVRGGTSAPAKSSGTGTISTQLEESNTLYPTINTTGSMYFIETFITGVHYESSTFAGASGLFVVPPITNLQPEFDTANPSLVITHTIEDPESGYNLTGSLQVYKGNADDKSTIGSPVLAVDFIVPHSESVENIELSGSFRSNFKYNDTFRMVIDVNKNLGSFLDITEYTMSLFPSESKFASTINDYTYYGYTEQPEGAIYGTDIYGGDAVVLSPGFGRYSQPILTNVIVPNFYTGNVLPFVLALDCQPLINNFNLQRQSTYLMDVDYTNALGVFKPVNYDQILERVATKATVPDSNYTSHAFSDIRYEGVKAQSLKLNVWSPSDFGTYGQLPVIELRNAYFGYFSSLQDPYPLRNDITRVNLNYLIDSQANALPPSLEGIAADILEKTFPIKKTTKLAVSIPADQQELENINDSHNIVSIGKRPVPILYTQTSSRGYSSELPFSGSGRLSLYDNPDTGFTDYSFVAEGTASSDNDTGRNIDVYLNPSSNYVTRSYASSSYLLDDQPTGAIAFTSEEYRAAGQDTSQLQYVDVSTSVPTTYVHSADYFRKGNWKRKTKRREYIELKIRLALEYTYDGATRKIPFVAEDVRLRAWRGSTPFDCGSVVDHIQFNKVETATTTTTTGGSWTKRRKRKTTTSKRYTNSSGLGLNRNNQLSCLINEDAVQSILQQNGLNDGNTVTLEWIFVANSGENIYKKDSYLRWRVTGEVLAGNNGANSFNPASYPGPSYATKISMIGSKTHLLDTENTASAPFWVFANELPAAARPSTDITTNYLYMSSSLINEAYGDNWSQGELRYVPGPYEGFPGNQEPKRTKIGPVYDTVKLFFEDEIRFGNNENFSYKIVKVWSPQENIHDDDVGRIKIELDRELPTGSLNKDFFLIRRDVESANSMFIDLEYPYALATDSSSFTPTEKRNGQLLRTDNALLGSIKIQPEGTLTGSYIDVPLIYSGSEEDPDLIGSGSGAQATIIVSGSGDGTNDLISFIQITNAGSGYNAGDILTVNNININPNSGSTNQNQSLKIEITPLDLGTETILVQDNVPAEFSTQGIAFPEFPSNQIQTSASIIINDLISKGVITS